MVTQDFPAVAGLPRPPRGRAVPAGGARPHPGDDNGDVRAL